MMRLGGSPVAPLTLPDLKTVSASSIQTTDGASALATLRTVCTISLAFLPGYLPSVLEGVRSNRLAPVSLATACTSIFLPVPGAPTMRTGVPHLGLPLGSIVFGSSVMLSGRGLSPPASRAAARSTR